MKRKTKPKKPAKILPISGEVLRDHNGDSLTVNLYGAAPAGSGRSGLIVSVKRRKHTYNGVAFIWMAEYPATITWPRSEGMTPSDALVMSALTLWAYDVCKRINTPRPDLRADRWLLSVPPLT